MIIRPFVKDDWLNIQDPIESDATEITDDALELLNRGSAFTVVGDNGIIGCGGVVLYNDNEGELWLRLSGKNSGIVALEAVCAGTRILKESFKDIDLYCRVRNDFHKGIRMVKWLGFSLVGNKDNYLVYKA